MSLTIEMLPAQQGDALWIEYGDKNTPRRFLYDVGTPSTFDVVRERIAELPPTDRHFELLIVSHIDSDHIGGSIPLLEDEELGATFEDVWFNGWRHLPDTPLESMGPVEGDRLTALLSRRKWNAAWGGRAVVVPADGPPPVKELRDGLSLTLLSPFPEQLAKLKPEWPEVVTEHGLIAGVPPAAAPELGPGLEGLGPPPKPPTPADIDIPKLAAKPFGADNSAPNGTSIVTLLEYDGKAVLLCADAWPAVVLRGVEQLLADRGQEKLALEAFKLPHHGSKANLHLPLLEKIEAPMHLISTNGSKTHHPNVESIARVLVSQPTQPELVFNYRSEWNEVWADKGVIASGGYTPRFPDDGASGIAVEL